MPFDHGLTKYEFASASSLAPGAGYEDRVMFVGETEAGDNAVLFCYDFGDDELIPKDCYRTYDITEEVWVRYFFKEPFLPEWRKIDAAVHEFVEDLRLNGR